MVTDIFDSIKFRLNDDHSCCSTEEYDRAGAAVIEYLLFQEKPLELTFPQLIDGYFASLGDHAEERQNTLFTLLERGHIKITSYYFDTQPTGNPLFNYLKNFPFKNPKYIYSSMPFLTRHIGTQDAGVADIFKEVQDYILRLFAENPISAKPVLYDDGTVFAEEMRNFIGFFERLTSCEGIRNQSIFCPHRAVSRDFSVFMQNALADSRKAAALFSLTGNQKTLEELRQCKTRSECNDVLSRAPSDHLSDIRRKTLDILYNKFTFSVFPDHEINVQQLYSEDQNRLLRDVLQKCDDSSAGNIRRYRKNETKQMYRTDSHVSCISVDDALRMRMEIGKLHQERQTEPWYDTVLRYRELLNLRLFGAEEDGKREFFTRGTNGVNSFSAAEGFAAAAKLSKLGNAMTRYENTFTFAG